MRIKIKIPNFKSQISNFKSEILNSGFQIQDFNSRMASAPRGRRRSGFTLLEMLVVIVVMALLMGVSFRLIRPTERARQISETSKVIGLVNAAISEYHAEYGIYPPVRDPNIPGFCGNLVVNSKDDPYAKPGEAASVDGHAPGCRVSYVAPDILTRTKEDYGFKFGLAAYLIDRRNPKNEVYDSGNTPTFLQNIFEGPPQASRSEYDYHFGPDSHWAQNGRGIDGDFTPDPGALYEALAPGDKEVAFYKRVRSLTRKFITDKSNIHAKRDLKRDDFYMFTIRDAWDNDLVYICPPPHTSFALFSAGPDHKCVADDPLNPNAKCKDCGEYHNKDNIYSSVDVK